MTNFRDNITINSGEDFVYKIPTSFGSIKNGRVDSDGLRVTEIRLNPVLTPANDKGVNALMLYSDLIASDPRLYPFDTSGQQINATGDTVSYRHVSSLITPEVYMHQDTVPWRVTNITAANPAVISLDTTEDLHVGQLITLSGIAEDETDAVETAKLSYNRQYTIVSISGNAITTDIDTSAGYRTILADGYSSAGIARIHAVSSFTGRPDKALGIEGSPKAVLVIKAGSPVHDLFIGDNYISITRIDIANPSTYYTKAV